MKSIKALASIVLASSTLLAQASNVIHGLTFTVDYDFDTYGLGIGGASTGTTGSQIYRGYSEFDISGQTAGKAVLSFQLLSQNGFESYMVGNKQPSILPKQASFVVGLYEGDNKASAPKTFPVRENFQATTPVASFASGGAPDSTAIFYGGDTSLRSTITTGQEYFFDVTDFYNALIEKGAISLGTSIVSSIGPSNSISMSMYGFNNFQLAVDYSVPPPIPEPETYGLLLAGLLTMGVRWRVASSTAPGRPARFATS